MKDSTQERVIEAQQLHIDQQQAVALVRRLLGELEAYLARRPRRHYQTDFDVLLNDLLPGLAMVIHLLSERKSQVEQSTEGERWGDLYPDTQHMLLKSAPSYAGASSTPF